MTALRLGGTFGRWDTLLCPTHACTVQLQLHISAGPRRSTKNPLAPDMPSTPAKTLDTFPNPAPERDYHIHIEAPEFTCLCPLTGQPDFATLVLDYIPDRKNIELKGLKLYLWSFRDEGAFHEAVTNRILDDLVRAISPAHAVVTGEFAARGGVALKVSASFGKSR